jgi:rRNA maturation endonuclease Nob1
MTGNEDRAARHQPEPAEAAQPKAARLDVAALAEFAADRPGDPACLLRRVCQACGAVADTDPPAVCPQCGSELPGS